MDSYKFNYKGTEYRVAAGSRPTINERPVTDGAPYLVATCAEILKLAGDRDDWKRSDGIVSAKLEKVRAQRAELVDEITALNAALRQKDEQIERGATKYAQLQEECDALRMTVEEGGEIERELSIALAILAGETLKPCVGDCSGHLREKAHAAYRAAHDAWHALQEGNQKLMADYAPVVLERDRLRQEVAFLRPGTVHPDAQDARLGREMAEILQREGGGITGESYPHLLRRIIQELDAAREHMRKSADFVSMREGIHRLAEASERLAAIAGEEQPSAASLDAQLGAELSAILERHCGERGESESAVETLRRIIRERNAFEGHHHEASAAQLGRQLSRLLDAHTTSGESYEDALKRLARERAEGRTFRMHWQQANDTANRLARRVAAVETENREKCSELAEKAGDVQLLQTEIERLIRERSEVMAALAPAGFMDTAALCRRLDAAWKILTETLESAPDREGS